MRSCSSESDVYVAVSLFLRMGRRMGHYSSWVSLEYFYTVRHDVIVRGDWEIAAPRKPIAVVLQTIDPSGIRRITARGVQRLRGISECAIRRVDASVIFYRQ